MQNHHIIIFSLKCIHREGGIKTDLKYSSVKERSQMKSLELCKKGETFTDLLCKVIKLTIPSQTLLTQKFLNLIKNEYMAYE